MRPMLVNTKQKVAVLATGLAVSTTGFVSADATAAPSSLHLARTSTAAQKAEIRDDERNDEVQSGPDPGRGRRVS